MKKNWYRLDNAALIFPAVLSEKYSPCFRTSIELNEEIDPVILKQAVNSLKNRFPTIFVKLKTGLFWYYLEENTKEIDAIEDYAYPLTFMYRHDLKKSCIKVLYYKNRFAVEMFHSVTDGNIGLLFAKNVAAQYIHLKYGEKLTYTDDILDINEKPKDEEVEDAFYKVSGKYCASREEEDSFHIQGTRENKYFLHLIKGVVDSNKLKELAHSYNSTVNNFLAGVMVESMIRLQNSTKPFKKYKYCKVGIPVSLRKIFGINTFRNFVLINHVGIDPRTGEYSLQEIIDQVSLQMKLTNIPQKFSSFAAANVNPSKSIFLKIAPLFLKTIVMKLVFNSIGETKAGITISNIGQTTVPENLKKYIQEINFLITTSRSIPTNLSVVSYNGKTYLSMLRSIKESEIERIFYSRLVELGLEVYVEDNERR